MALNFSSVSIHPKPHLTFVLSQKKDLFKFCHFSSSCSSPASSSSSAIAAVNEGTEGGVSEEDTFILSGSSARSQLDLLDQLSTGKSSVNGYESDGTFTVREQLVKLVGERDDEFSIPLGKNLKKVSPKLLTISQKRNIKRQAYLNEVTQRNDSVFFATIGAFVLLPPLIILGIAIATGYVQLFP